MKNTNRREPMKAFTPSARAQAVTIRTYCRPLDEAGSRFETWDEVIQRSQKSHHERLWAETGKPVNADEIAELTQLGLERKALVSGRTLWLGGTEYAYNRAACNFNCCYTVAHSVYDIVDIGWLLLNGCGVGFEPKAGILHGFVRPIPQLEMLPSNRDRNHKGNPLNEETLPTEQNDYTWTIKVGDSAQAWAKAIGKMFNPRSVEAKKLVLDFSDIRGAGGRLKGYGWICNGYRPLAHAMAAYYEILNNKAGDFLDEIDILDTVNHIGQILSSRRAAELAQLPHHHPRSEEFAEAKKDYWLKGLNHRRQSNNSHHYWSKPSRQELTSVLEQSFENGDPGIINAEAALRKVPYFEGVNPSLRAGTKVLTQEGVVPIEQLEGKDFYSPNLHGEWSPAKCFLSGKGKQLYKISLVTGHDFYATAEHKWPVYLNGRYIKVQSDHLVAGDELPLNKRTELPGGTTGTRADGFIVGYLLGNGSVTVRSDNGKRQIGITIPETDLQSRKAIEQYIQPMSAATFNPSSGGAKSVELHTPNAELITRLDNLDFEKGRLPSFAWSGGTEEFRKGLLDGLLSSDGCISLEEKNHRVSLSSTNERLAKEVGELLGLYGIKAYVKSREHRSVAPNGNVYNTTMWMVRINGSADVTHFAKIVGQLTHAHKNEKLQVAANRVYPGSRCNDRVEIRAVEKTELFEDVWDVSVNDTTHCFTLSACVTGNCGETLLGRLCNLFSVSLRRFGRNYAAIERAVYIAARANYRQTLVNLNDGVLQPTWHQANEAQRLCGVTLTGVAQADWISDYQIRRLRNSAICGAYSMADELGLQRPKAVTLITPSGTRAKIDGDEEGGETTEGIHKPLGRFIFNNVNFSIHDPLVSLLQEAGYKTFPNPSDSNNVLVCFPVEYKNVSFDKVNGLDVNLESATKQLDRYLRWNTLWCDHNSSATISFDREEIPAIVDWLTTHWDLGFIAVSFLRRNNPLLTPEQMGHQYLPQQVVAEDTFRDYAARLRRPDWSRVTGIYDIDVEDCPGGVCPVK